MDVRTMCRVKWGHQGKHKMVQGVAVLNVRRWLQGVCGIAFSDNRVIPMLWLSGTPLCEPVALLAVTQCLRSLRDRVNKYARRK